jgi:hydroxyacylglutathione hydrolase
VYLAAAGERDLRITHVVETHLHNDYVSGGRELAALTGAEHRIGAGAELRFDHRPVRHDETFSLGSLVFRALETPGHTPEHVAYAVSDTTRAQEPILLFTGGSLLVGAVGRTDLLGAGNAVPFGRAMYRSLQEVILPHEDFVGVYPTHGAGSLCSTGISPTPFSTIGFERRHNRMLRPADVDTFVQVLLRRQPSFPTYFARMRPTNQAGPRPIGRIPEPVPLPVDRVRERLGAGAALIDLRDPAEHALAHVPGSYSIPSGPSFGTWLGWILDPDRPLVLLLDGVGDWDDAIRQAYRIGYERVEGYLQGGFGRWAETGGPTESTGRLTVDQLGERLAAGGPSAPLVIDVRQATEYAAGHIPGSVHIEAGRLTEMLDALPHDRPLATVCASGYRSSVAASLLRRAGFADVSWVAGGLPSWRACGLPVDRDEGATEPSGPTGDHVELAHRH